MPATFRVLFNYTIERYALSMAVPTASRSASGPRHGDLLGYAQAHGRTSWPDLKSLVPVVRGFSQLRPYLFASRGTLSSSMTLSASARNREIIESPLVDIPGAVLNRVGFFGIVVAFFYQ